VKPETPRRSRGRPRRLPVTTDPINDVPAFMRLKSIRLDSYQAIRTVGFCAVWQREGNGVAGVVASGHCGRSTAFNRLRSCRAAGFEPGLVRFKTHSADEWLAEVRHQVTSSMSSTRRRSRTGDGCRFPCV
jgi:hypothetical protein